MGAKCERPGFYVWRENDDCLLGLKFLLVDLLCFLDHLPLAFMDHLRPLTFAARTPNEIDWRIPSEQMGTAAQYSG